MLYQVTYSSNEFRVKAYMCLPEGCMLTSSRIRLGTEDHAQLCSLDSLDQVEFQLLASRYPPQQDINSMQEQWPVLIYCRGGLGSYGGVKTAWVEQFTHKGYIVFAPSYRGNEGGEGRDEYGGHDIEDVRAAYRLMLELPFADPTRISLMGFSRGAINAVHTATSFNEGPNRVHKLVLWSGVADVERTYHERTDLRRTLKRVLGGSPRAVPEAYLARSPLSVVSKLRCPVLIMHGTADTQVNYSHGTRMYHWLKQRGIEVNFHAYGGQNHWFHEHFHLTAVDNMFDWLTAP
ncbi:alpha/beta hydrolase family protein [Paenibacillus xylanilyticus]|uniref:alpha/beta hydrolase family protein n=1 Tax=Paenibacillus xylanilyticus TaxID=248903 RepID=UPI001FE597EC|nr:prolyl oligopeptidase family serine peptidase [Paenibacillus xylanilyticus]